jgi:hypothetical protein
MAYTQGCSEYLKPGGGDNSENFQNYEGVKLIRFNRQFFAQLSIIVLKKIFKSQFF